MKFASFRASLAFWMTFQVIGLALVLGMLVLNYGGRSYAWRWERSRQREALQGLMDVVEPSASAACFADDGVLAEQVVRGLIGTANVQGARIRSGDKVLAEASRPFAGPPRADFPAITRPLASPFVKDSILGELTLIPDAREAERLGSHTAALFRNWILGILGGFAVILTFTVRSVIVRPLLKISRSLRDFEPTSGVGLALPRGHSGTEIGGLVRSVNGLIQRMVEAAWKAQGAPGPGQGTPADTGPAAAILVVRGNGALEAWTQESLRLLDLEHSPPLPGAPFQSLFGAGAAQAQACLDRSRSGPGGAEATLPGRSAPGEGSRQLRLTLERLGEDWFQIVLEDVSTGKH